MNIALIDNDLACRINHNFPNLAIMKISAWHKQNGDNVRLVGFNEIDPTKLFYNEFDKIYISKAFTDTQTPEFVHSMKNVQIGGTGFYFDKAGELPYEIEHIKPNYDAYKTAYKIIKNKLFYTDYSIGYTTRGCFRHCSFCVNKNSNKVNIHSPIDEFYDSSRKKIALLDDNILGLPDKHLFKIFDRFEEINKPIQYRQGMDIRLLTKERIERLFRLKYDGGSGGFNYYFSFDLWEFRDKIEQNLKMFSEMCLDRKPGVKWIRTKLYCFCGFNPNNEKSESFWLNDLELLFKRFEIIFKYKAVPYVMKHKDFNSSPFSYVYNEVANYANGLNGTVFMSFNEYLDTAYKNTIKTRQFRDKYPQFKELFNVKIQ
jgi:hypothetical protein